MSVTISCAGQKGTGLVGLGYWLSVRDGVMYGICYRVVETLDFACSDVVLEWDDCCDEITVCIFVLTEVGEMVYWCFSVVS